MDCRCSLHHRGKSSSGAVHIEALMPEHHTDHEGGVPVHQRDFCRTSHSKLVGVEPLSKQEVVTSHAPFRCGVPTQGALLTSQNGMEAGSTVQSGVLADLWMSSVDDHSPRLPAFRLCKASLQRQGVGLPHAQRVRRGRQAMCCTGGPRGQSRCICPRESASGWARAQVHAPLCCR